MSCPRKEKHAGCWYYVRLAKEIQIQRVEKWLAENPPPADWQECEWAWAYTEMAIIGPFLL